MKKRLEVEDEVDKKRELEIIKAVAQAWYSHGGSTRPLNEFDARKNSFRGKPSRFKLEAMKKVSSANKSGSTTSSWDFGQSLWDSYEIVTVSKRLETGLVLDSPFFELDNHEPVRVHRRKSIKESKNSLRSLFNQMSSRRFDEAKIPYNNDL
ncbi:hypothetical protein PanWU01x14_066820 [Parasponia andersonii]|uniref:Uncharacterized protein n=1 Tax=Parasponia andersonii TaxID=3476 RepID=A0A2P5DG91_PARAD|nr:hypothetical protein PanWU01x14_066820 [Parasponia andersonii]